MLIPVILSGGAGTRLWPISRESHPKPFIRLADGRSLLQKTLQRATALEGVGEIWTITNCDYYFHTRDQYAAVTTTTPLAAKYLLEPFGRNTAPAICLAAIALQVHHGDDAIMLVLPADHLLEDASLFQAAVSEAAILAEQDKLVTFGIHPSHPETGYGYIECGASLGSISYQVKRFVEKPDSETAAGYLSEGGFFWNSGMFCFKVGALLRAMQQYAPAIFEACMDCWNKTGKEEPIALDAVSFDKIPEMSIDYAVMEHTDKAAVVTAAFAWSDIGSWQAMSQLVEADNNGNQLRAETVLIDTSNCYIQSDDRLIAAVGVDDLIVVDTPDALLIAQRGRSQDVKRIVRHLKEFSHPAYQLHRTVHRPWGTYTQLEQGSHFKIKRIAVKPGASLSLQLHHHRSEHWVVVSGTAMVVNGEEEKLVKTNESTYIPAGTVHRLSNPGVIDCVIIEVQSGEYLEEDDIVRLEDMYGRIGS